ncbi:multidrug resistance protein [Paenibacillus sp. J31TS4]|uniref:MFS transporter n=1 Tax=Paenibacillus sp. J31TS4 TaxID=2807195 RepID=UPI001B19B21F|nr:MFS transporter [Paenibacillus sp. J31TS4]GIP39934.1 multidrug resistance protein [Paenibacillus sp. J31TS4]
MEAGKRGALLSVATIPLIMTLGSSMVVPVLPKIADQLGVSPLAVSLLITVYSAAAILLVPLAGYLSDRFGRKAVILPGLLLAGMGGAVSGTAAWLWTGQAAYGVILAGRLLQGIGAAGAAPIVLPLIGDLYRRESDVSRGLGIVETANTFGKVLSPILGAALAGVVWFFPFFALPVFCAVSMILVAFLVKAPQGGKARELKPFGPFLCSLFRLFGVKGRWLFSVFAIGGVAMFVIFGVQFYLSSILEAEYGIRGVRKGLLLAIPLASISLTSYLTGRWIGRSKKGMKRAAAGGLLLLTASLLAAGLLERLPYLLGSLFVGGIGIGAALPCMDAFLTQCFEEEQRGTVTSLYSSARFLGVALGPPAVSLLMQSSHRTLFFLLAVPCAAAALLALFAIRPREGGAAGGDRTARKRSSIAERVTARLRTRKPVRQ